MAEIAKGTVTPSLTSLTPAYENQHPGLKAGEVLAAGDACYIKSDNTVWRSNGTAVNAAAQVDGFAAEECAVGEAITLYHGVRFRYGANLTPGAKLFVSATAPGGLADVATTGGTAWVAKVIKPNVIFVRMSTY
jgi:hypothetical protein